MIVKTYIKNGPGSGWKVGKFEEEHSRNTWSYSLWKFLMFADQNSMCTTGDWWLSQLYVYM